jgi:archaemetzincin
MFLRNPIQIKLLLSLLLAVWFVSCTPDNNKIAIQPYEDVPAEIVDSISNALQLSYGTEIIILQKKSLPKHAFVQIKTPRYRADLLLDDLLLHKPDSVDYIIGVTQKDISTTKKDEWGKIKQPESKYYDWGIFGLGSRPGKSCVISIFRLGTNPTTFYERLQKIAVHEIGHNKGLKHCDSPGCVMQDAVETIQTVDDANKMLCKKCEKKI